MPVGRLGTVGVKGKSQQEGPQMFFCMVRRSAGVCSSADPMQDLAWEKCAAKGNAGKSPSWARSQK